MASTRRLAAILAADVAGYSRLMGADEEGTHERLKAHLAELVDPKIAAHRGRIVKNTGDGLLGEFASVVDAVRCAVDIQRGMIDREPDLPEERRIRFRIGVNLGDVIAEQDDIFGDGVNVAARLEALAEPGGICISRMVRDQIRDKLPYQFEDKGEQSVKNIARPVRVYALRPEVIAELLASSAPPAKAVPHPAVAPRLSIVVLPFTNLGNDPEQQYFADAITEDLTTDLSRIAGMFVISRNTAFTYQGKRIDTKQIGRELNVRYVLEGSVRRSGAQVRVNAQLIEAETAAHVWAERFTGDLGDLFALQDEITSRIAIALDQALVRAEAARPSSKPDALDCMFRGRAVLAKSLTRDSYAEAIGSFERALALDPRSVEAQLRLVQALTGRVLDGMSSTEAADIARAEDLLGQAFAISPDIAFAHYAKGQVLRAQRRYADAIPEYETAIALDRNSVRSFAHLGQCKLYTGSLAEVIPMVEQAIRLSPRDAGLGDWYQRIGLTHLLQSRTDEAIAVYEKSRSHNPAHPWVRSTLAAAYGLKGETERAAAELAEARRLSGNPDWLSSVSRARARHFFLAPKVRALFEATYFAGLRKAGMPEE
jgi:TolB-like protein/class 3 adenylate cyclase/Tfp pilus assembly protein PilF